MMRFPRIFLVSILVLLLITSLGLAVPNINVSVQSLGNGEESISTPVERGTVCVPYAYAYYIQLIGWFGPFPINNIQEVYPGNFTSDLVQGTNLSIAIYDSSSLISTGRTTLTRTLQAGDFTRVSINPPIDSNQAQRAEFRVIVQSTEYSVSSSGSISIALQKLGIGMPTGNYGDYWVLARDGGWYRIYVILRCYELLFAPESPSSGNLASLQAIQALGNTLSIDMENSTAGSLDVNAKQKKRPLKGHLQRVLLNSRYIQKLIQEILSEIESIGKEDKD